MTSEENKTLTLHSKVVDYYLRYFVVPSSYPGDKKDLRQVGLLGLLRARETWDSSKSSFRVWAWYWIRSFIRGEIKKHKHLEAIEETLSDPANSLDRKVFLLAITEELNGKDKELLGRFCCGQNTTEIGKSWGISRQAVDQRLSRILLKIRKEHA